MLVFVEGGKPENPEENPESKVRTNNKLNPQSQRWDWSEHLSTAPTVLPLFLKVFQEMRFACLLYTLNPFTPTNDIYTMSIESKSI